MKGVTVLHEKEMEKDSLEEVTTEVSQEAEELSTKEKEQIPSEEESELLQLRKEMEEMKSLAQRTQADFINYKKRVEKEKREISIFANERIMEELLDVLDNFERALISGKAEETTTDGKVSGFYQGVEMILKQLTDKLNKFGLSEIEALGADFDPNFHHAVMQVEGDEPDKVVEVMQRGYLLREKVIRPSMVKVSK